MKPSRALLMLASLCALPAICLAEEQDCKDLSPSGRRNVPADMPLSPIDLVRLRDMGPVSNADVRAHFLELSPDGSKIAFQIRRADPTTNSYCFGMFVMPVRGDAKPVLVNKGGEFIPSVFSAWGFAVSTPPGTPATITPKWSPDGRTIAFLRRDNGVTQVWTARVDGSHSAPVTRASYDIEDVIWDEDGRSLIVSARPALDIANHVITEEGRAGYLYDDRFIPATSNRPVAREPVARTYSALDIASGSLREANADQQRRLDPATDPQRPEGAILFVKGKSSQIGCSVSSDHSNVNATTQLKASFANGGSYTCALSMCADVINLWWSSDGKSLIYLRREGWGRSDTGLYQWEPGLKNPVRILLTGNALTGCQMGKGELVCGEEGSTQPRRLVSISLTSGKIAPLFDPNPEFQDFKLGTVTRLKWKNSFGIETFGDLILPVNYLPGQTYPLVLVQYESRGFLRGGTGDDFPMQSFATKGFAVLSVQRPDDVGTFGKAKSWLEVERINRQDWADFRSVLSSLETGAQLAISMGVARPGHVGLTGLSNGASNAQFALINSRMFSAVAVSNCCEEPAVVNTVVGPAFASALHEAGYPGLTDDGQNFWMPMSIVLNAAKINVPLLIQVPDREYLGALEGFTALKEHKKPVEMYVFPDEYHIKWQPEHRLASYHRSLDWFGFWLKDQKDSDPRKDDQYRRWEALRQHKQPGLSVFPEP
jgi:dipeptidyl aminopeptidase/acylaminoacyl peptidase